MIAKIYVNGIEIQSTNNRLKSVSSEVAEAAAHLTSLKSVLDYRIVQRKGIDSRLNQSAKSLRELERKMKAVHQFIDHSVDEYEKADRKAASVTIPGGKSFWEKLGDGLNTIGEVITGFGSGLVDTLVSTVEGLWNVITHPIQTVKGLVHVVQHPVETGKAIWQSITDSWKKDVINGDAESASHWFGQAFGEAALAIVGTKGVDKAVKLTKGVIVGKEAQGAKILTGIKASDEVAAGTKVANQGTNHVGSRLDYLRNKFGKLSSEELHARINTPQLRRVLKDYDPSKIASSWQGSDPYFGVDHYRNIALQKGDVIYAGEPYPTGYFTTKSAIETVGNDAREIFEGLQVKPYWQRGMDIATFRDTMVGYEMRVDLQGGHGLALNNPQFGKGGLEQIFLPDLKELIHNGFLKRLPDTSIQLSNSEIPFSEYKT